MRAIDEATRLLQQLTAMLQAHPEAAEKIHVAGGKLGLILQNCVDRMPLLADTRTRFLEQTGDWSRRFGIEKADAQKLSVLFEEAKRLLHDMEEQADYYAQVSPDDGTWRMLYGQDVPDGRVLRNDSEFERIWDMLERGENFALTRGGDGECAFMEGRSISAVRDHWTSPDYVSKLGYALLDSLQVEGDNYYTGISCPCCDPIAYFYYRTHIKQQRTITLANIWANANYKKVEERFPALKRDAVVIANYRGKDRPIGNLNVLAYYPVSDDCVSFWENEAEAMIGQVIADFGDRKNLLYVVSAGPMSGPIIAALYKNNPDNCYVDFGSSISRYIHGESIRNYTDEGDGSYAGKMCWMPHPAKAPAPEVTAVMTLYKRPETLRAQLEALENQTLPPKEILLFQDVPADNTPVPEIPEDLRGHFSDIRICTSNQGVWGRFAYAEEKAQSRYIAVFDDDTIPGSRWLENCYMHMIQKGAIYVTIGILLRKNAVYPEKDFFRVGWGAPYQDVCEVDFGGHAWFFTREHLDVMLKEAGPVRETYKYLAEDMWLSRANKQENGVPTVVPPHKDYDPSLWGSIPEEGWKYGSQEHALSMQPENLQKMADAMNDLQSYGWRMVRDGNEDYVEYILRHVKDMGYNMLLVSEP